MNSRGVLFVVLLAVSGPSVQAAVDVPLERLQEEIDCYKSGKCSCPTQKKPDLDLNVTCGRSDSYSPDISQCQDNVMKYNRKLMQYNADVEECVKIGNRGSRRGASSGSSTGGASPRASSKPTPSDTRAPDGEWEGSVSHRHYTTRQRDCKKECLPSCQRKASQALHTNAINTPHEYMDYGFYCLRSCVAACGIDPRDLGYRMDK